MRRCWRSETVHRPSFAALSGELKLLSLPGSEALQEVQQKARDGPNHAHKDANLVWPRSAVTVSQGLPPGSPGTSRAAMDLTGQSGSYKQTAIGTISADAETAAALAKEFSTTSNFNHDHVLGVVGKIMSSPFTVLHAQPAHGSFADALAAADVLFGGISAAKVALDFGLGIEYLHAHGIVHGTLSTHMCMVDARPDGQLVGKVAAVGMLGELLDPDSIAHTFVADVDTPALAWLGPEAFGSNGQISSATDVYSFGAILWEACGGGGGNGKGPGFGKSAHDLLTTGGAGPLPSIIKAQGAGDNALKPEQLVQCNDVIEACCDPHPLNRPAMAGVVTLLLETIRGADSWELPRTSLEHIARLGGGEFGDVHKMILTLPHQEPLFVAVKTLKVADDEDPLTAKNNRAEFLREAMLMKRLRHPNLVRMLGLCTKAEPALVVLEFLPGGALDEWVFYKGETSPKEVLIGFVHQIALGMMALGELAIVHRDLAGRNVLVGDDYRVKVADYGLSRDADEDRDYYRMQTGHPLPLRWTAPEVLRDKAWKSNTDIYSFGIVISEIYSFGGHPFDHRLPEDDDVVKMLGMSKDPIASYLDLGPPGRAPSIIHKIVEGCVCRVPERRPTFHQVCYLSVHVVL